MSLFEKKKRPPKRAAGAAHALPRIAQPEACNLCSFCVQTCPTNALTIREDEETTALQLMDALCLGCSKCVRICPTEVLHLEDTLADYSRQTLRISPRTRCKNCGQPIVSQAEMEAVRAQIGEPEWLQYCLDCRAIFLSEKSYELSR